MTKDKSLMIAVIGIVLISAIVPTILSNSKTSEVQSATQIKTGSVAGRAAMGNMEDYFCLTQKMDYRVCTYFCDIESNGFTGAYIWTPGDPPTCCCRKASAN